MHRGKCIGEKTYLDNVVDWWVALTAEHFTAALCRIIVLLLIVTVNTLVDFIDCHDVIVWPSVKILLLEWGRSHIV